MICELNQLITRIRVDKLMEEASTNDKRCTVAYAVQRDWRKRMLTEGGIKHMIRIVPRRLGTFITRVSRLQISIY